MRFRCLVMDHDDTTVNSTATIHFPSFLAYLKLVRPEASYTLEDYFRKNFDPGIMALFTGEQRHDAGVKIFAEIVLQRIRRLRAHEL